MLEKCQNLSEKKIKIMCTFAGSLSNVNVKKSLFKTYLAFQCVNLVRLNVDVNLFTMSQAFTEVLYKLDEAWRNILLFLHVLGSISCASTIAPSGSHFMVSLRNLLNVTVHL